jgi:hypothetical protein
MKNNSTNGNGKGGILLTIGALGLLVVAGYGVLGGFSAKPGQENAAPASQPSPDSYNNREREQLYQASVKDSAVKIPDWPKTEQDLITRFWQEASRGNIDGAIVYTPGGKKSDFAIFEKFRPQPAKAIGKPEPHPEAKHVTMWPVTVPFPGFPEKTVKMAIFRLEDGRLAIDGRYTIWW